MSLALVFLSLDVGERCFFIFFLSFCNFSNLFSWFTDDLFRSFLIWIIFLGGAPATGEVGLLLLERAISNL